MSSAWTPANRLALLDLVNRRSGAEAETFFEAHDLGQAYRSPGAMSSKRARMNAALRAAGDRGDLDAVLEAAGAFFADPSPNSQFLQIATTDGAESVSSVSRIFVSHASADKKLADLLRDTLILGGVPEDQLFYSSDRSTGIPAGEDVGAYLRRSLQDAALVVELLSTIFLTRPRCLMELGGAWTLNKPTYPIVVPPLTREEVRLQIGDVQTGLLGPESEVDSVFYELHDRLAGLGLQPRVTTWNRAINRFKDQFPEKLATAQVSSTTMLFPTTTSGAVVFDGTKDDNITIDNISLALGRRGRKEIHAEATNHGSVEHSFTVKGTFYDQVGHITGTSGAVVNQLRPGGTKTFTLDEIPDHTRGKVAVDTVFAM